MSTQANERNSTEMQRYSGRNRMSPQVTERAFGGQGGIRTHGELSPTLVFKTSALNRSATCPIPAPLARLLARGNLRIAVHVRDCPQ